MTTPPRRLAPLEIMTEYALAVAASIAEHNGPDSLFFMCVHELEAQRLARARERRAALEEAIAVVKAQGDVEVILAHMLTQCHGDQAYDLAVGHCASALEALRDREEA